MQRAETAVQVPHLSIVLEEPRWLAAVVVEECEVEDRCSRPSHPCRFDEVTDVLEGGFGVRDHASHPFKILGWEERGFEGEEAVGFGEVGGDVFGEMEEVKGLWGGGEEAVGCVEEDE